jgi:hypothetical protein
MHREVTLLKSLTMLTISDVPTQLHKHSLASATDSLLPSLGNLHLFRPEPEKFKFSDGQINKNRRFLLLDNARRILQNHNFLNTKGNKHRTRTCLAVRYDKNEDIGILLSDNENESETGLSNLVTCRSICSCPVCAHRMMLDKAQDIKKALIYAKNNGLVPLMLTLTASHHKNGKLAEFKDKFKSAWQYFSSGRQWKEFKKHFGIYYYISAREVTRKRQDDNGWHYHMHILLFLDPKNVLLNEQVDDIHGKFTERWMKALTRNELNGIPEIACDLRAGAHVGEHYLTKLGITENAKGQLDYELTGSANKGATIWDILDSAAWGDVEAEYQYLEYVEVMQGENWITFSHGLWDLVKDIEVPEPETENDTKSLSLWYWISQENWNVVVRSHAIHHVLRLASRYRDRQIIDDYIQELKHERERKIPIGVCDDRGIVSDCTEAQNGN